MRREVSRNPDRSEPDQECNEKPGKKAGLIANILLTRAIVNERLPVASVHFVTQDYDLETFSHKP